MPGEPASGDDGKWKNLAGVGPHGSGFFGIWARGGRRFKPASAALPVCVWHPAAADAHCALEMCHSVRLHGDELQPHAPFYYDTGGGGGGGEKKKGGLHRSGNVCCWECAVMRSHILTSRTQQENHLTSCPCGNGGCSRASRVTAPSSVTSARTRQVFEYPPPPPSLSYFFSTKWGVKLRQRVYTGQSLWEISTNKRANNQNNDGCVQFHWLISVRLCSLISDQWCNQPQINIIIITFIIIVLVTMKIVIIIGMFMFYPP